MKNKKIPKQMLKCNKCGYRWVPRVNHAPIECPECKSRRWNN